MATRSGGSRSSGPARRRSTAAGRSDKSVQAFREALDRSVTLSRDRLQEVIDDAVERGRMTRGDANELVSRLVSRGRQQSDELVRQLERLLQQARREVEVRTRQARREVDARTKPARRRAERAAGKAARAARDAADRPLASADRARRRAGVPARFPITAYDQLTANQVKSRLGDLSAAELRKVRDYERRRKGRKSVLADVKKRLAT